MTGEADLRKLLAGMRPSLSDTAFAFATLASRQEIPATAEIVATFKEEEGLSVIAPLDEIVLAGINHSGPWAKITLTIHSSLSAVGLTAAIATALAQEGISANVVAAYFHDHIFVPWNDRHEALRILDDLGSEQT